MVSAHGGHSGHAVSPNTRNPNSMKSRIFGPTARPVSEIGLGCWQLGGADWGDISDERALQVLLAAVDAGVTFLDTADVYGAGRSEELVGRLLRESGSRDLFVATKLGRGSTLYPDNYTEAGVRKATESSLKRIGVETIDLTQLHCVPESVLRRGEIFEWLRKLQDEGKIRGWGASVESIDEGRLCLAQEGIQSLQVIFNLFRQKPAYEIFDECSRLDVGIIVRLPLASGLLSGKFTLETRFPANDHRTYNRNGEAFNVGETFAGLPFEKGVSLADSLRKHIPKGWSMTQFAQRWILDYPAVTTVITGASRPEQARDNAQVSDLPHLSPDLHKVLRAFHDSEVLPNIRGPY